MTTMDMILTLENYFTPENTAISNSKVGDFLKSKEYYYKKHISHEIEWKDTPSMKIGRLVDDIVTRGEMNYKVKVLKKDDPDEYEAQKDIPPDKLITQEQFEEACGRAQAVIKELFYKWYEERGAQFQVLLQSFIPYGAHPRSKISICGIADIITETRTQIFIDDLKSVGQLKVASPQKWFWNCKDMGYFRQMAVYKYLWQQMHKRNKKEIICRHVVVTKEENDLYKVMLYVIDPILLEEPLREFIETAKAIFKEKEWKDEPVTWKDAKKINPLSDEYVWKTDPINTNSIDSEQQDNDS